MMHSESYRTPNGSIFVKMVHTIPYRINKVCSVFRFFSIWGKLHVQVSSDDDCVEGCCYFVYFSSRWRKSSNSVSQNDAWWKNLGLLKIFVFSSSEHHLCLTVNMYWSFFCHISSLIQCYCLHDTSLGCSLSRLQWNINATASKTMHEDRKNIQNRQTVGICSDQLDFLWLLDNSFRHSLCESSLAEHLLGRESKSSFAQKFLNSMIFPTPSPLSLLSHPALTLLRYYENY